MNALGLAYPVVDATVLIGVPTARCPVPRALILVLSMYGIGKDERLWPWGANQRMENRQSGYARTCPNRKHYAMHSRWRPVRKAFRSILCRLFTTWARRDPPDWLSKLVTVAFSWPSPNRQCQEALYCLSGHAGLPLATLPSRECAFIDSDLSGGCASHLARL
jgi:hypothetical protein